MQEYYMHAGAPHMEDYHMHAGAPHMQEGVPYAHRSTTHAGVSYACRSTTHAGVPYACRSTTHAEVPYACRGTTHAKVPCATYMQEYHLHAGAPCLHTCMNTIHDRSNGRTRYIANYKHCDCTMAPTHARRKVSCLLKSMPGDRPVPYLLNSRATCSIMCGVRPS